MEHIWFTKTIHFDPELGYVMLRLPKISLPPFTYDGVEFEPKTEFYCSLLSTKVLASKYFPSAPIKASEEIKEFVEKYVSSHPILFKGFTNHAYICQDDGARSIIMGAKLQGTEELFVSLRAAFPELSALPDPLLHVTLYKYNHRYGIGIHNKTQLQRLCRPILRNHLPSEIKEKL